MIDRGAYVSFLLPERNRRKAVQAHWANNFPGKESGDSFACPAAEIQAHGCSLSPGEFKSWDADSLFMQDLMAVTPCASTQSGLAYVHG